MGAKIITKLANFIYGDKCWFAGIGMNAVFIIINNY
jgi:hypothetical protein